MASQWHYQLFGEEFGPVSEDVLRNLLAKGTLAGDDSVRTTGGKWIAASVAFSSAPERNISTATAVLTEDADEADESEDWYCQVLGQELGPLSFNDLLRFAESGELSADDQIRFGADGKWRRVGSMGRLVAVLPYQAAPATSQRKARTAAAPKPVATVAAPPVKTVSLADLPEATELKWFAWIRGVEYGPSSLLQLQQSIKTGQLSSSDFVKLGATGTWCPPSMVNDILTELVRVAAKAPAAVAPVATPAAAPPVTKPSNPVVPVVAATPPANPVAPPESKPAPPPVVAKVEPVPPPPKPETTPTASSYGSSSSYGGSSTSSWQSQAAKTPPKPTPKPRASSGSGMSFDFSAITSMLDAKTLGVGGGALAAVALVYALMFMPTGNGVEVSAFKQLHPLLVEFQKVRESKGSDAEVQAIATKVEKICPPIVESLKNRANVTRPASQKLLWISKYRIKEMIAKGATTRSSAEIECESMMWDVSKILNLPMDEPKPLVVADSKGQPSKAQPQFLD